MKENKQNKQKQPQANEDLPATVFEGRAVKAELSDIYDLLTDYADDAKQQLMDGVEPFEILVQRLDDLDHTKFLCTVPVGYAKSLQKHCYTTAERTKKTNTSMTIATMTKVNSNYTFIQAEEFKQRNT